MRQVLGHCVEDSSLQISSLDLDRLSSALFTATDVDCSGLVTFDEFMAQLDKQPHVLANLTIEYGSIIDLC